VASPPGTTGGTMPADSSSAGKIRAADTASSLEDLVAREHREFQRLTAEEFQNCLTAHAQIEGVSLPQKRQSLVKGLNELCQGVQMRLRESADHHVDVAIAYRSDISGSLVSWVKEQVESDFAYAVDQRIFRGWLITACDGIEAWQTEQTGAGLGQSRLVAVPSGTMVSRWLAPRWLSSESDADPIDDGDKSTSSLDPSSTERAIAELWIGFNSLIALLVEEIFGAAEHRLALALRDDHVTDWEPHSHTLAREHGRANEVDLHVPSQHETSESRYEVPQDVQLGQWAEERLGEIKKVNRLVYSGNEVENLRYDGRIGNLKVWEDVFDELTVTRRQSLLSSMKRRILKVDELLETLGDVKGLNGETLKRHRKKYRRVKGLSRARRRK
jgi:hypothetical protein